MPIQQEKNRRSREEKRHGGCAAVQGMQRAQKNGEAGNSTLDAPGQFGCRNIRWPAAVIWPILIKPSNNFVVLFRGEGLSFSDARKKPAVGCAMPSNSRFAQLTRLAKRVGETKQVFYELCFHEALIVGRIPLCNRKHPIRFWGGKFPMMPS